MAQAFTKPLLEKMIALALDRIEANLTYLNELDSATGDGDHGTAIHSTMQAANEAVKVEGTLAPTLNNIAMAIMNATGGSTSSLNGAFYLGMSMGAVDEELTPAQTVEMFKLGVDNLKSMTTAKLGDKTMMDAIFPARDAMVKTIADNPKATLVDIMTAAADAAKLGAEATRDLVAKQGRAKNLGDRTVGHVDAGATSFALVIGAFADAAKKEDDEEQAKQK